MESAVSAPQVQAASYTVGALTVNCRWELQRLLLAQLDEGAALVGGGDRCCGRGLRHPACGTLRVAAVAAASVTGPVAAVIGTAVGIACTAAGGTRVALMMNALQEAASMQDHPPNGACFKITVPQGQPGAAYFSTNMGQYCRD